jgi:hypothetical protein
MQVFFSCQNCGHDLQADCPCSMPVVECPDCGQYTPIPSASTRTPSDEESREAPAAATTTEIDVVEMPVEPRKTPPPLPGLRKPGLPLELDRRHKLQYALGSAFVGLIFVVGVILIIVCSGGDPKGYSAICLGMLVTGCVTIGRCLYLLATTPRSITRAAFRDRNYWYSFFFIYDKPPEDYGRGNGSNDDARDSQRSRQEDKNSQRERPRDGEILLALFLAIATLLFSCNVLAPKLVLIGHYGWAKVQQEQLHFLEMPKGHRWPVSNGDRLEISFAVWLVSAICWFGLFFSLHLTLRLLLPKRKNRE